MRYLLTLAAYLPMQVLAYVVTPVLPLFAKEQDGALDNNNGTGAGPRLPSWLSWFDTPDNSLNGDACFQAANREGYLSKVRWLYRNSLYGFKWSVLSLSEGDPSAWQFKREYKYIWLNLGWMLDNPEQNKLMFQFSIRRAKSKL
jgi:hypothetical protein